jgi:hypothetical protein
MAYYFANWIYYGKRKLVIKVPANFVFKYDLRLIKADINKQPKKRRLLFSRRYCSTDIYLEVHEQTTKRLISITKEHSFCEI